MNENNSIKLYFRPIQDYSQSVAVFDAYSIEKIKNDLIDQEEKHGLYELYEEGIYSPESQDYLYLYNTLRTIRENYNINYDRQVLSKYFPSEKLNEMGFDFSCKVYKIPYVHLKIGAGNSVGARADIFKHNQNIHYIEVDYQFVREYLDFLIDCFDPLYNNENKESNEKCFIIQIDDEERKNKILEDLNIYGAIECEDNKGNIILLKKLQVKVLIISF